MIFLSDFIGAEVVDVRQHRVGRVRDLVVVMAEPFPRVTGIILKGNRKVRSLDYAGPVFTRDGREQTFPLSLVGLDGPRAPLLAGAR